MLSNFAAPVRFDEFMRFALYHPEHGYYARGQHIFGQGGDFITAPELGPLFGQTLGKAIASALPRCGGQITEFGAGSGQLACDVLNVVGDAIEQYCIVEVSGGLQQAQRERLTGQLPADLVQKVRWLSALPDSMEGVLIGNEVLDATPVRRFKWTSQGVLEAWVQAENNALAWHWRAADATLNAKVSALEQAHGPWPEGYISEWAEQAEGLMRTLTERLHGLALMVDYGHEANAYYAAHRTQGTLRATRRHVAHDDFLKHLGEQDLTAHVDFTAMYNALAQAGGQLEGYTTQAEFLIGHGILEQAANLPDWGDAVAGARARQAVHTLLSESNMGHSFKVLAWSRGVNLEGTDLHRVFVDHDHSGRL
ncbi:MAG TPA: SAM-dependent methyltransferase [Limnobacter sp.]|nr:SAM-dependent methyltransferase [Limnobacter sp.]